MGLRTLKSFILAIYDLASVLIPLNYRDVGVTLIIDANVD